MGGTFSPSSRWKATVPRALETAHNAQEDKADLKTPFTLGAGEPKGLSPAPGRPEGDRRAAEGSAAGRGGAPGRQDGGRPYQRLHSPAGTRAHQPSPRKPPREGPARNKPWTPRARTQNHRAQGPPGLCDEEFPSDAAARPGTPGLAGWAHSDAGLGAAETRSGRLRPPSRLGPDPPFVLGLFPRPPTPAAGGGWALRRRPPGHLHPDSQRHWPCLGTPRSPCMSMHMHACHMCTRVRTHGVSSVGGQCAV